MGKIPIMHIARSLSTQQPANSPQIAPLSAIAEVEESMIQVAHAPFLRTDELLLLHIACNALRIEHSTYIRIGELPKTIEPGASDNCVDSLFVKLSVGHLQQNWILTQIARAKPEHVKVFMNLAESSSVLHHTRHLLQNKYTRAQNGELAKPKLVLGDPERATANFLERQIQLANSHLIDLFPDLISVPESNFDLDFGRFALWATKRHTSLFHTTINKLIAISEGERARALSSSEPQDHISQLHRILYQILLGQGLENAALTLAQHVTNRLREIESGKMTLSYSGADAQANLAKVLQLDGIAWWNNFGCKVYMRRERLLETLIEEETRRRPITVALRTLVFVRTTQFDNYPYLSSTRELRRLMEAAIDGLDTGDFHKLVAYHLGLCWILPKTLPTSFDCGLPPPPASLEAVYPYALDALGLLAGEDRDRLTQIKLAERQKMAVVYPTTVKSFNIWVERLKSLGIYSEGMIAALDFMSSALCNYSVPYPLPLPMPLGKSWKDLPETSQPVDVPKDPQSRFAPAGWVPVDHLVRLDDDFSPESLRFALSYLEQLYPDQHGHFHPIPAVGKPGLGRKGHFFSPGFVLSLRQLLAAERFLRAEHHRGISIWPS